ncbi:Clan SC, family S28, unassigned serine peptidase [Trichomonas vaginalis G3]|uniref:Clan SC, family S28, unassigned serine peptidase n=1 Tax=Trichomonas vaginalis (strain ATCC PRA-98 / G3) TaxID=412133 RepID=A2FRQ0_TRIV3|nr:serine-type peptidase protein [Trichomonas vaginalis G3]EAX92429.1 Clan SC, family S28, unassigned serine peptidase [Trichomonas vaginalis G3]KAI5485220.1 serine-type peptidase protein [Trichomonas vaginalis G3]|eukprot:XP_001305359.1 Clan SC, family S28, unassigned serine peptidase [Trichomonas vaginalis G3]
MNLCLLACLAFSINDQKLFEQYIDHEAKKEKYNQTYYVNDFDLKKSNNLVFLVGNQESFNQEFMTSGTAFNIAKDLKAILFGIEHRYFGESKPTESLSTEELQYLTVEQTIEDVHDFIAQMRNQYCKDLNKCQSLTVGQGYGGSIAAWVKVKYGEQLSIISSWASASPLLAKNEFSEFDSYEAQFFKNIDSQCYTNVKKVIDAAHNLLFSDVETHTKEMMMQIYGIRPEMHFTFYTDFMYMLSEAISQGIRNRKFNSTFYDLCDTLSKADFSDRYNTSILLGPYTDQFVGHASFLKLWPIISKSQMTEDRARFWMKCNQLDSFPISSGALRSTYVNSTFWNYVCQSLFEKNLPDTTEFNNEYGGKDIQAKNSFFTSDDYDAYTELSCIKDDSSIGRRGLVIINAGYGDEFADKQDNEPEGITFARQEVINTIHNWFIPTPPTTAPTTAPTSEPTSEPTTAPTTKPTTAPTSQPTTSFSPSIAPQPTDNQNQGLPVYGKAIIGALSGLIVILIIVIVFLIIKRRKPEQVLDSTPLNSNLVNSMI